MRPRGACMLVASVARLAVAANFQISKFQIPSISVHFVRSPRRFTGSPEPSFYVVDCSSTSWCGFLRRRECSSRRRNGTTALCLFAWWRLQNTHNHHTSSQFSPPRTPSGRRLSPSESEPCRMDTLAKPYREQGAAWYPSRPPQPACTSGPRRGPLAHPCSLQCPTAARPCTAA